MDPQEKVNTLHWVFLKGIPEDTPQYEYVSYEDVNEKIYDLQRRFKESSDVGPFLVFRNLPVEDFKSATGSEQSPIENCRFTYSRMIQCLVIELLSDIHKTAREAMVSLFDSKISEMGLYSSLQRPGTLARTYDMVSKQPDAQWLPCHPQEDPSKPTIILEVATEVSQLRIENDAKRWLTYPNSPVMMVITVAVYDYPKINTQVLMGLRMEQFSAAGMASEANITRSNGSTCAEGALIIPFEFIFWREKNKENPKEKDVVLKDDDLKSLAETIWKAQGLI